MESLVNYSSEDEQEEMMDNVTAERGNGRGRSPSRTRRSYGIETTMMGDGGSGGSRRDPPSSRSNIYKDESKKLQSASLRSHNNISSQHQPWFVRMSKAKICPAT
uniref:Uncharacterized protein n=1 Tax=Ceratitis capitata TaxID=7213 RepID=W8CBW4_CERCA